MRIDCPLLYCDSTVNIVVRPRSMAPTALRLKDAILKASSSIGCRLVQPFKQQDLVDVITDMGNFGVYHDRTSFLEVVIGLFGDAETTTHSPDLAKQIGKTLDAEFKRYAAFLIRWRAVNAVGYPNRRNPSQLPKMEGVMIVPGRVDSAAKWSNLRGSCRFLKRWLNRFPRIVAIDSEGVFDQPCKWDAIVREVIDGVHSPGGRRHVWMWRTTDPTSMALFSKWLEDVRGIHWPPNLVPIIHIEPGGRCSDLLSASRKIKSPLRAVYFERFCTEMTLSLQGIDWVIVEPDWTNPGFDSYASVQKQCCEAEVAFFVQQEPYSDIWSEWISNPEYWEVPAEFLDLGLERH